MVSYTPRIHPDCKCDEAKACEDSGRFPPLVHNCGYIKFRNKLIPKAEKRANVAWNKVKKEYFGLPDKEYLTHQAAVWNKAFFQAMDQLFEKHRPY